MQLNGLMGGFYRISEWVMRLAYINLLWILFTVVGLLIFGFMPATIAMFTLIRKWIMGETDTPVFSTFFYTFKKEFLKGNGFGLIILIIGYILYIDFNYLAFIEGPLYTFLLAIFFLIGIVYLIFILYFIPVYVHFDLKFKQYLKYSIMIGITNFHITILLVTGISLLYYISMKIPGVLPFFTISITGFFVMWTANLAFKNLVTKKENYLQNH